jgi:cystathionine beta-lyase/cystathionine gamma-synthase
MKRTDVLAQTIRDLTDDVKIFTYITLDYRRKLIESQGANHQSARKEISDKASQFVELELRLVSDSINQFRHDALRADAQSLSNIYAQKQQIIAHLHQIAGLVGQIVTMSHWQSPAIDSAVVDNVGSLKGKILAHFNDYTRDMHVLGVEFEKAYRKQYVPIPHTIPVFTFATSSGMAAMTTAALFIQGETPNDGTILMGKSCYFETKQLINKLFGHRVHEVDLSDTELTRDTCNKYKPVAIFADTLGNEPSMRQVEISDLVHLASGATRDRVFIVCDPSANTLSATYIKGFTLPTNITLIGIESQNKLLQYGLDRVCAGIVWGTGYISQKLYDYRDHAGTICPDTTIATLPTPNREMAKLYTKRLVRNTEELVSYLRNNAKIKTKKIHVIYPAKSQGVYLILHWRQSLLHSYNRYIHQVVAAAKKSNIQIVHGTSFGLQTTRIYTVAMHTQYSHSFLRISLGSETASQIQTLGELLTKYL